MNWIPLILPRRSHLAARLAIAGLASLTCAAQPLPVSQPLMRALEAELGRAMNLQLADLEKPYFVQYTVEDSVSLQITARYGAITSDARNRQRELRVSVRVGTEETDNTNFADSYAGGYRVSLPLDDNELALRQNIWLATDREYKDAVETLTRKRAYMRDKRILERPHDFSPAVAVTNLGSAAELKFDAEMWRTNLVQLSAHLRRCERILDSEIRLLVGAQNVYVANSEGSRLRLPDTAALLQVSVETQAADGMRLSDERLFVARDAAGLPSLEGLQREVDQLVADLDRRREAEVLDRYTGPVLFDGVAGPQLFLTMLGEGLAGKPDVVGEQRRTPGTDSLEHKLGTRLLPGSFQVWDDPGAESADGHTLLGHYRYDDEAVAASRVDLVKDGRLSALCLSRAPTRKLSGSNGHGRATSSGPPRASVANLFIRDEKGMAAADLKRELLDAARDEGLDYALRVSAVQLPGALSSRADVLSYWRRSGRTAGKLGDPVVAYKVSVKDGSETPIRGVEFAPLEVRALRRILAAGDQPQVYNRYGLDWGGAGMPVAVIAPSALVEEMELSKIQEEFDQPPLLQAPDRR